jgi:hypothetical protein
MTPIGVFIADSQSGLPVLKNSFTQQQHQQIYTFFGGNNTHDARIRPLMASETSPSPLTITTAFNP